MRTAKVTYLAPGAGKYVTSSFEGLSAINKGSGLVEVVYGNNQTFVLPVENVAFIETHDQEKADDDSKQESEGAKAPTTRKRPAAKSKS